MYRVYQIGYNETIDTIADKFNTTVDRLREINSDLNTTVGNYIIVPVENSELFKTYTIKSGDSLYKIAKEKNVDVDILASINGLNKNDYIYPNQEIVVPSSKSMIYITKINDTLDTIANKFNTDYDSIIRQNKKIFLLPDQLVVYKNNGQ